MLRTDADFGALFFEGARCTARELRDPKVASSWDRPSVLEGQNVSGLVGHLARGGIWVVDEYLARGVPVGPVDYESAADYFLGLVTPMSAEEHLAIRDRGAEVASVGHAALMEEVDNRLDALTERLRELKPNALITVAAGKVLRVRDYLVTRIVEQVVHLDDLARSLDEGPCDYPAEGRDLVLDVGVEMARSRAGTVEFIRALFRRGAAESVLPVL
jgi:hypothetical protein